jgi:hypothetical protein
MRVRPVSPALLVDELADLVDARASGRRWLRVGFDGVPSARPDRWADALLEPLRLRGRPAVRVSTEDFLRPASVRLERGRTDPDAFYEQWYDLGALSREVLDPLSPTGTGRILTSFWNPVTDRSTRASYVDMPEGGILLLSGPLLLGTGLDLDLTVHCAQTGAAMARRTPEAERWRLPAFARYTAEVAPELLADVVVRSDDPDHPAVVQPPAGG